MDQTKPKPMDIEEQEQPRSAPKVLVPLQPTNTNEGQPINFTAKVQGNPQPTVSLEKKTLKNFIRFFFSLVYMV